MENYQENKDKTKGVYIKKLPNHLPGFPTWGMDELYLFVNSTGSKENKINWPQQHFDFFQQESLLNLSLLWGPTNSSEELEPVIQQKIEEFFLSKWGGFPDFVQVLGIRYLENGQVIFLSSNNAPVGDVDVHFKNTLIGNAFLEDFLSANKKPILKNVTIWGGVDEKFMAKAEKILHKIITQENPIRAIRQEKELLEKNMSLSVMPLSSLNLLEVKDQKVNPVVKI